MTTQVSCLRVPSYRHYKPKNLGVVRINGKDKDHGEPKWPNVDFDEFLDAVFEGRVIESLEHEVAVKILEERKEILHSRADDVVTFADSEELVRNSGLPLDAMVEAGGDHRLADPESPGRMLMACEKAGRLHVNSSSE